MHSRNVSIVDVSRPCSYSLANRFANRFATRRPRVNIGEIAKLAGVSRSTVSYVLSGKRQVSPELHERITRVIEESGYRPNATARALAEGSTKTIGLVIPPTGPHLSVDQLHFVGAVAEAAAERDYDVLLSPSGPERFDRMITERRVDGVILMEVQRDDPRIVLLKELQCPAVIAGSPDDPAGLSQVDYDFDAAARMAVEHLHERGHRHIGYLGHPPAVLDRGLAYVAHARDAVLKHANELFGRPTVWAACDSTPDGALESVKELLNQDPDLTGLIVYNERALPLVVHHLGALGRQIPSDISVVGMGYDDEAEHCVPPCTSVALSADSIARAAVAGLAQLIRGEPLPARVELAPTLTIRASTGS